ETNAMLIGECRSSARIPSAHRDQARPGRWFEQMPHVSHSMPSQSDYAHADRRHIHLCLPERHSSLNSRLVSSSQKFITHHSSSVIRQNLGTPYPLRRLTPDD